MHPRLVVAGEDVQPCKRPLEGLLAEGYATQAHAGNRIGRARRRAWRGILRGAWDRRSSVSGRPGGV